MTRRVMVVIVTDVTKEWQEGQLPGVVSEAVMVGLAANQSRDVIRSKKNPDGTIRAGVAMVDYDNPMVKDVIAAFDPTNKPIAALQ